MINHDKEISLKDIAKVILPKLWLVLLVAVLVAALTFIYCEFIKKDTYSSSFDLYIYKGDSSSPTASDIQTAEDMLETYEYILKTDNFLEAIILKLPEEYSSVLTPEIIRSMMRISSVGNSGVLRITFTSTDPAYVADVCKNITPIIPNQIIDSLPNPLMVAITDGPTKSPIAPNPKHALRNSLILFIISAFIVMICVWLDDMLDTTIRDKKKIEENFDIPVLGAIPRQDSFLKYKQYKEGENGTV